MSNDRSRMRLERSIQAYNSLIEELNQLWMESNDQKAKKLYDKVVGLSPAFKKVAKSACGIKMFSL